MITGIYLWKNLAATSEHDIETKVIHNAMTNGTAEVFNPKRFFSPPRISPLIGI